MSGSSFAQSPGPFVGCKPATLCPGFIWRSQNHSVSHPGTGSPARRAIDGMRRENFAHTVWMPTDPSVARRRDQEMMSARRPFTAVHQYADSITMQAMRLIPRARNEIMLTNDHVRAPLEGPYAGCMPMYS